MKKPLLFMLLMASIQFLSFAQLKSKEELEKGNELKKLYPEDDVCAANSTEVYSFALGKNDSAGAAKLVDEDFIALKDNSEIYIAEPYNHFSTIEFIKTYIKKGNGYSPYPAVKIDQAYFQSDIFDDDNRYNSFKLPFATLGAGAAYELSKSYKDVRYLPAVFFHDHYPIEKKTISVEVPDWFKVDIREFNFDGFDIKKTQERNEKSKSTIYKYTLNHCIALKSEDDAPAASFSWPHLVIVPKSYTNKSGKKINLFGSVDDLYAWYSYLISKTTNDKSYLKGQVDKLTTGKTSDEEKIKAIYYWVQDNVRYIAFESGFAGFVPESADKVYKTKYGDCKGMANLMTTMLQLAGYDARMAWIGTRDIPYDYSLPSLVVDNHMICALVLKDSTYFLDGTERFISFGDYAYRIQGRPALIQNGKKYIIMNVPDLPKERNRHETNLVMTIDKDVLKGKATAIYNGESQTDLLRYYSTTKSDRKEDLLKYIANHGDKNFSVSNLKTSDLTDREKPVEFDYDFTMQNRVTEAGGETYVSIDFSNDFTDKMPDEKRQNDYEFQEKVYRTYHTEFEVPAGYQVKYMPEALNISTPDYKFNVTYEKKGNKVIMNKVLSIDNGIIKKSTFDQWRKDLKQLKNMSAEQLVLAKK